MEMGHNNVINDDDDFPSFESKTFNTYNLLCTNTNFLPFKKKYCEFEDFVNSVERTSLNKEEDNEEIECQENSHVFSRPHIRLGTNYQANIGTKLIGSGKFTIIRMLHLHSFCLRINILKY